MYDEDDIDRLNLISTKIDYILDICENGIIVALEDNKVFRPAIMMHLASIAEQFSKLKSDDILNYFDKEDIKGAIATRNFIAHDYEGVSLPIIEYIIREKLPYLQKIIEKITKEE